MNVPSSLSLLRRLLLAGCLLPVTASHADTVAWVGGHVIDGTGNGVRENTTILAKDGRITSVGPAGDVNIPAEASRIDVSGLYLMPGLINAHGHLSGVRGLESGHYTRDNLERQLALYARYGVTTVASLGGDGPEAFALRDEQDHPDLDRARLMVAGPVLNPDSPEAAREAVTEVAASGADFIKFRIDDFLGRGRKMEPAIYQAIGEAAAGQDVPVAVHIYELEDAFAALDLGARHIAHSVRDRHIDQPFIDRMRDSGACYMPTLTRELSTYVYESAPDFFSDPFFLREADPSVLSALLDPERQQQMQDSEAAQTYKAALPVARSNLKMLADARIPIAMGTDSGPAARFQGYFEHLELWMMADSGLTAAQILGSATRDAAGCLGLENAGTLEPGKHADLLVLTGNPLENVANTRTLVDVYIAGNRVP
ncbi:MAG: amidohydrolase family protein [Pseudohongiellaceae bacterium]